MYEMNFLCWIFLALIVGDYGFPNEDNNIESRTFFDYETSPVVKLPELGTIQGSITQSAWTQRTIYQFLGFKYAESPRGNRRFKPPVAVGAWKGVKYADKYGRSCPILSEIVLLSDDEKKSDLEDCLTLDIYTTEISQNVKKPVMVYVHGGSFYLGASRHHPPNYLLERDIVLVVPNYRLDALGFLSTQTRDIPGNAGLLDVIAALEFVQKNIIHFGGDPNCVTLFGQSAGAAMVSALTISSTISTDLFHKAIIQSGSVFGTWAYMEHPVDDAKNIARKAGLSSRLSTTQLNRAFINMDLIDLLNATELHNTDVTQNRPTFSAARSLTIGGPTNILTDTPDILRRTGNYRKDVPILLGTTKHDGSYLTTVVYDIIHKMGLLSNKSFMQYQFIDLLLSVFGINDVDGVFSGLAMSTYWTQDELVRANFSELATGITDLMGANAFKGPVYRLAETNSMYNSTNTFLYTFDYNGEFTRFKYEEDYLNYPFDGGVTHSNDNLYIFPYPLSKSKLNEDDTKIAKIMVDLWTSFAANGVPTTTNGTNPFKWEPVTKITGPYLHIDKDLKMGDHYVDEYSVATREARKKQ